MDTILDYRGKTPKKTDSGVPLVTAKIIKNGCIQPIGEYIAEDDYEVWMTRGIPMPGDVVITTEAPLGEVAQLDQRKVALAQRVITLRGRTGLIKNSFLKYLMMSANVQHQLDGRGTGTTVKGIKQSELRKIRLTFPSYAKQEIIGLILGTLDDKIELNRQTNETLEAMAQALFKSWFVDFDPVIDNALAAGNEIPEPLKARAAARLALGDARKPLPEEICREFPDGFEFVDEMGWVPRGWSIQPLSALIGIKHGFAFKGQYFTNEVRSDLLVTPGNFKPGGGFQLSKYKYYNGPVPQEYVLKTGDIVVTMTDLSKQSDTLGYPAIIPSSAEYRFLHNQRVGLVTGLENSDMGMYIYHVLKTDSCRHTVLGSSTGTTVVHTSPKKILAHRISLSENGIEAVFGRIVGPYFMRVQQMSAANGVLKKIRDTLLPKLLSGELTIPDTEKLVADAL